MAFINLFTNSGGHCMSEIRQLMTRKRQTHEILQYFMLFGDGAPSFSDLKGTLKISKISEGFKTSNKCNPQSTDKTIGLDNKSLLTNE